MRLKLFATTLVTPCNLSKAYFPLATKDGRARIQTAVSSGDEYSMISVPRFFWLDFASTYEFDVWSARITQLTISMIFVDHERTSSLDLDLENDMPKFLSQNSFSLMALFLILFEKDFKFSSPSCRWATTELLSYLLHPILWKVFIHWWD